MAFTEDLTAFFVDFGVDGTFAGTSVRVIYDAPASVELGGITATQPSIRIRTKDMPASWFEAAVVLPAGNFEAREHYPDGTGMSVVMLTRTA